MFERVDRAVAVANADEAAKAAADHVTDAANADGFLEAVEWLVATG
jgi:hydroxymethylpyrimidine pyrophosphatase-like HAD family hydrolase